MNALRKAVFMDPIVVLSQRNHLPVNFLTGTLNSSPPSRFPSLQSKMCRCYRFGTSDRSITADLMVSRKWLCGLRYPSRTRYWSIQWPLTVIVSSRPDLSHPSVQQCRPRWNVSNTSRVEWEKSHRHHLWCLVRPGFHLTCTSHRETHLGSIALFSISASARLKSTDGLSEV